MEAKKMTIRMWHGCAVVAALLVVAGIARAGFGPGPVLSPEQELARLQRDFALTDKAGASASAVQVRSALKKDETNLQGSDSLASRWRGVVAQGRAGANRGPR